MNIQATTFTVSQLNQRARQLIETHFPLVWVQGEISNFSQPGSGHWYLTLKDEQAQVRCAMFRNRNSSVRFSPKNGVLVLVRCRVSLYEGRGEFQLIIEHMEEAGFGVLQREFEQLKKRLSDEGLFNHEFKHPLPSLPTRIGLITSPTGAAIQDIISVLKRRFPAIPVLLFPSIVQGKGTNGESAANKLADCINFANEIADTTDSNHNEASACDVLILSRGGGSIEDLWAFNEEILARAIFNSKIPIISAVGHEVDFTIADFVADYRAATPSAAAEIVTPDSSEMMADFKAYEHSLLATVNRKISSLNQQIDSFSARLRHPGSRLAHDQLRVQSLQNRLWQVIKTHLNNQKYRLQQLESQLSQHHPSQQLETFKLQLGNLEQRLLKSMTQVVEHNQSRWNHAAQRLSTVSPLNTLMRGYAIVLDQQQHVVRSTADLKIGQQISTKLVDGLLLCTIDKIQ